MSTQPSDADSRRVQEPSNVLEVTDVIANETFEDLLRAAAFSSQTSQLRGTLWSATTSLLLGDVAESNTLLDSRKLKTSCFHCDCPEAD
ncbi:hypothetical protein Hypma_005382 [Hypsizygus marmoreus]|uniref:Uncharacterized protein n=1 Tax=Hypsizygus marmoreus TaxID=39966 RepID=A0A369K2G1_HYPMA|nr:hypothetical protein Hypma_005382 [Hypsizygus marmoreus]